MIPGILSVAAWLPLATIQAQGASALQAPEVQAWMPGEVLLCPAPGREDEVATLVAAAGLRVLERDALSGVQRVGVPAGQELLWTRLLSLAPGIDYAERDGTGRGGGAPSDTHYGAQWHLRNTGQSGGTSGADIAAEAAWSLSQGSSSIVVAVLDTGIDSDHPEFAGRIDPRGFDFVNEDANPEADHPHGTWVSGCLGANADNALATAGVDRRCRILPLKVLNASNGGSTFDLAQALHHAAALPDVHVISMSLINYPGTTTLRNALRAAHDAGKILIACAGNGGIGNANQSWPGASPLTISIGATTHTDARAGFSGTGSRLDFVAPGDSVVTTAHGTSADTYSVVSGCSFATPIAAGVVGLLLSLAEERGLALSQDDVHALLRAGAVDQVGLSGEDVAGRDDFHGHGRIDAQRTLLALPHVVPMEVAPGSCPKTFALHGQAVLPIVLFGSAAVDVASVDPGSVTLSRTGGIGGAVAPSAAPPHAVLGDVGAPTGADCDCHALAPDGIQDLTLFFPVDAMVLALELDTVPVKVVVRGALATGQPFVATDCLDRRSISSSPTRTAIAPPPP